MKAMLLAAGRGERLKPLTNTTPKPLLTIKGKPIIVYHLERLAQAGIQEVVINTSYLSDQIQNTLGDGSAFGLSITYTYEKDLLGTGGAIANALPFLGNEPFILISGDIYCDYPFVELPEKLNGHAGHLILADNTASHPSGDFALENETILELGQPKHTYTGIAILHPNLFINRPVEYFSLLSVLKPAIEQKQITGEVYTGKFLNINTVSELQHLSQTL